MLVGCELPTAAGVKWWSGARRRSGRSRGLARVTAGQRLSLLMRGELWLAPEMHASRPGPLPAFPRARPDQFTLELGQAAEHGQHQAAMRGRRICPSILQGPKAGLFLSKSREGVEEIAGGAGQPVEAGDEHDITGCQRAHEAGQFGAVGASPADLLAKDLLGPCSLQLGDLGIEGLTVGRDAGVAVDGHGPEVWRARREAGQG